MSVLSCLTVFNPAGAENPYGIAVIVGNSDYSHSDVPDVAFAHRDADAFRDYVVDVLGYRAENIIDLRDASQAEMIATFGVRGNHEGRIWQYYRGGRSDIVVFYSGHGVPGRDDQAGYLLPSDADPLTVELNGYPIEVLYENLAALEARSVTVFLDACFSGGSHAGMLIQSASPVFVSSELPDVSTEGFTVLTAASDDQLASWDEQREHGLFTGYLLDGLYGAADGEGYGNGDGQVSVSEVKAWLDEEMTYAARRHFRRHQEATLLGNPNHILSLVPDFSWGDAGTVAGSADEPAIIEPQPEETQVAALPSEAEAVSELSYTILDVDEVLYVQSRSNVRSGPGTEYDPPVGQLEVGEEVSVTGRVDGLDWYRIALASGREAFIYGPLLGAEAPNEPEQVAVGSFYTPPPTFRDCPDCPELIVVPAGSFLMGSPPGERGRQESEGPTREVRIAVPFAVGVYEVTFTEWDACVDGGGCNGYRPDDNDGGRGNMPVFGLSWHDAQSFVAWLSNRTGEHYRLLSEAEWEYAARAGTQTAYWMGDDFRDGEVSLGRMPHQPVGSFPANEFGLYDVHGNVHEWTQDCWNDTYDGAPTDGGAWISGDCEYRVVRSASAFDYSWNGRSARRTRNWVEYRQQTQVGLRVARDLD